MAGKGSRNRVSDRKAYEDNYEKIFRKPRDKNTNPQTDKK